MRTLVIFVTFLLGIPAYAALPPAPPTPISRPAPLQSPRAASVPKSTPMAKASTFTQASTGGGPLMLKPVLAYDLNYSGCDTNDTNCITYDLVNVPAEQRAGYDMSVQFTHSLGSGWTEAVWSGAGPEDRVSEVNWFRQKWQRPVGEFWRSVSTLAPTTGATASRVLAPAVRVNAALPGIIRVTTRKK